MFQEPTHGPGTARDKIKSLAELGVLAADARAAGRKVVLCHGVFDLLHMGHVRHLEAAGREGDVLMVTITGDAWVNKGPGRPVFPELTRAEMLAAIHYVDWVAINCAPSAEPVLERIRPDVYVKGAEYENAEDDVTGRIGAERAAVEAHGGRLAFTRGITFSSSSLINRHLDVHEPELHAYLQERRGDGTLDRLLKRIDAVRDFRVLVVGDTIIDEYRYVAPLAKSPKENMIATLYKDHEVFAGGVIAAANHVAGFCHEVDVVTMIGDADADETVIRSAVRDNVRLHLIRRPGVPTTRKCRYVEAPYFRKLFEVYHMDDCFHGTGLERRTVDLIAERAADADLVIVTDFGHGLMTPPTVASAAAHARFLAVNTQTNSANLGFNLITRYPRADYISIDMPEARMALGERFLPVETLAAIKLPARVPCSALSITQGALGCTTWGADGGVHRIPVFTKSVVDTVGAGDAFLAVTAPLVAAGARMDDVGFVGNAAGAIKVGIVGHRGSVDKAALIKYITSLLK